MKYKAFAAILCFFAVIKTVADIFGFEKISAVAAISHVSPAMKVFTTQRGYETFSPTFELTINQQNGQEAILRLNSKNYAGLRGPYNRRNVYGALISYAPVLVSLPRTEKMWQTMAKNAFCRQDSVLFELGIDDASSVASVLIEYHRRDKTENSYPTSLQIFCE